VCDLETSRMGAPYIYIYGISRLRVNKNPLCEGPSRTLASLKHCLEEL